jgi:hypothetical protein
VTLAEFLLARVAEDEASITHRDIAEALRNQAMPLVADWVTQQHERLLAECEAKRRIVSDRERIDRSANDDEWSSGYSDANYDALRALALPYADHPDFRAEWQA